MWQRLDGTCPGIRIHYGERLHCWAGEPSPKIDQGVHGQSLARVVGSEVAGVPKHVSGTSHQNCLANRGLQRLESLATL
jgi:hypothetical protein